MKLLVIRDVDGVRSESEIDIYWVSSIRWQGSMKLVAAVKGDYEKSWGHILDLDSPTITSFTVYEGGRRAPDTNPVV